MTGGYNWFRCSSDGKIVVGTMKRAGADLVGGVPPGTKIAIGGDFNVYQFDISPNGSKVAYYGDLHALCEFSLHGTECADRGGMTDLPSVNDSGDVLVAVGTGQSCFFRTAYDFSTKASPGTTEDECLGIGYWKPGIKSVRIIQPLGRNPQWVKPQTAALLGTRSRDLAATGAAKSYIDAVVHSSYQYEPDPRLAADQPSGGTAWYTTALNASNCDGVASMLATASGWQNDTIPYGSQHAVNSNTVAHLMGNAGGFYPSAPFGSFGW